MLPDSFIEEYQELYLKHYNIEISKERAMEEGLALGNLLYVLLSSDLKKDPTSLDDLDRSV